MHHNIPGLFHGGVEGGNALSDWATAHRILAALVIYTLIGIIFWIWIWTGGDYGAKPGSRTRSFFEIFYAPTALPAAWLYGMYNAVRGAPTHLMM